jgi:hypothetical protein
LSTARPTTQSEIFFEAFARQEVPNILEQYPWTLMQHTRIHARQRVTSHKTKNNLKNKKYLAAARLEAFVGTVVHILSNNNSEQMQ